MTRMSEATHTPQEALEAAKARKKVWLNGHEADAVVFIAEGLCWARSRTNVRMTADTVGPNWSIEEDEPKPEWERWGGKVEVGRAYFRPHRHPSWRRFDSLPCYAHRLPPERFVFVKPDGSEVYSRHFTRWQDNLGDLWQVERDGATLVHAVAIRALKEAGDD